MQSYLALTSLVGVAFITPGPNNVMVMQAAARGGLRAALSVSLAVAAASVLMMAATTIVFRTAVPGDVLRVAALGGCAILAYSALSAWRRAGAPGDASAPSADAIKALLFQVVNPKAWVVVTATCSSAIASEIPLAFVCGIAGALSFVCLMIWGVFGHWLTRRLRSARSRALVDRSLAFLLLASAVAVAWFEIWSSKPQ
jgi:threonine/homoserine/homoserine lactone efflux protein